MTETTDLTAYGRYLSAVAGLHPDTVAYHLQHVQRFLAFAEQKAWQLDRLPEKLAYRTKKELKNAVSLMLQGFKRGQNL